MTTKSDAVFTGLLPRLAAVALGSLVVFGCDAEDPADGCFPEQGCDGVVDVLQRAELEVGEGATVELDRADAFADDAPGACSEDSDDGLTYVAHDAQACSEVAVVCHPGWVGFASACGCGCEYVGDTTQSGDLQFRGGHRQTYCFGGRSENWADRAWKCM